MTPLDPWNCLVYVLKNEWLILDGIHAGKKGKHTSHTWHSMYIYNIYIYIHMLCIIMPGTLNNLFQTDGHGDFQPFPM